jgi:cytochrome c peroxidase
VEVLGTPETDDFNKPHFDSDSGRFRVFPTKFYVGAFKTPTVRNVAVTAPYMHNGAFNNLKKVVEFYDKGGGVGLGLKVEAQTLPSARLKLSDKEVKEIVSFLQALTDSINVSTKRVMAKN